MGTEPAPSVPAAPASSGAARCQPAAQPWTNWGRSFEVRPRCISRPRNLAELRDVVRGVSENRGRLRAVGSGLSASDILQTDDTLVVLSDLQADAPAGTLLPLENELWHDPAPSEPRVRVICGARIRELNAALDDAGLAFPNLGGYDGQTMIGALSTSTHGSGVGLGPLCDLVRSLDLVSAFGKRYRVEPSPPRAISDPARFVKRYGSEMTLVQDDDWFYSLVVSLGCMGVIYAATLAVSPAFDLEEHRELDTWSNVRRLLVDGRVLRRYRHYEVLVNPHPRRDGEHSCLVTRRSYARPGAERIPLPSERVQAEELAFASTTQEGLLDVVNGQPRLVPLIIESGLDALVTGKTGHVDQSHKIFHIGKINYADVLSAEFFMPLAGERFVRGIDRLIAVVADNRRHGIYQTVPLALRFVQGSPAYLSMVNGRGGFGSVETPVLALGAGAADALLSYEQALYEYDARPHWGQNHELTGARGWWQSAYPEAKRWQRVFCQLNEHGVFDNHFTERLRLAEACGRAS